MYQPEGEAYDPWPPLASSSETHTVTMAMGNNNREDLEGFSHSVFGFPWVGGLPTGRGWNLRVKEGEGGEDQWLPAPPALSSRVGRGGLHSNTGSQVP